MKTIAVLAALAAVAVAVPALPGYDRYRPAHYRLPASIRREKKSPQSVPVENPKIAPIEDDIFISDIDTSARTIGLKKPIIVKKKFGYHVYRDSEEEQAQAGPQENCTKEVKVKLCDAEHLLKPSNIQSESNDSSTQTAQTDMKQSIKIVQEAVENLQKITQLPNAQMGPDAELHGDIEVARQALEHIQHNFGNLEAMNVQATTLSEAEALQNARFAIAKTDNEKMAQWKEAIDNIQKNAELAKNIEDSFKSPNEPRSEKMTLEPGVSVEGLHENLMKSTEEKTAAEPDSLTKTNADHENFHEMHSAASEHVATLEAMPVKAKEAVLKLEDIKVESDAPEKHTPEHLEQGKTAEVETLSHTAMPLSHLLKSANLQKSVKAASAEETNDNNDKVNQPKASEHIEMDLAAAPIAPVLKASANSDFLNPIHLNPTHRAVDETMDGAKSSEVPVVDVKIVPMPHNDHEKAADLDTTSLMKSAEPVMKEENLHNDAVETEVQGKEAQSLPTSHENKPLTSDLITNINLNHASEMKSADLVAHQSEQVSSNMALIKPSIHQEMLNGMRASESKKMQEQLHEDIVFRPQSKNWHADDMTPQAGKSIQDAELARNAPLNHQQQHQFASHHSSHFGQPMHHHQHFEPERHNHFHGHGHGIHEHQRFHGKSADADSAVQATNQVNEVDGKAAMEHNMLQWKQKAGAARGAYGVGAYGASTGLNIAGGAGSGPGAVGVFPGASVGGCAIPLLLSCSPSVVPGSLAKAPAYGAHAYRGSDDFEGRFHNKRDTKKNKELITTKVKRTPSKAIQKIPLDKKL